MSQPQQSSNFEVTVQPATSMLREVIEKSAAFSKTVCERLDINETDFQAMEHLIANGPMKAGDLARAVGISPGSATVMIDRLVAVGHVTREANPKDRRGVLVCPNPKSVATAWAQISPLIQASEDILSKFSIKERSAVEEYLAAMLKIYTPAK